VKLIRIKNMMCVWNIRISDVMKNLCCLACVVHIIIGDKFVCKCCLKNLFCFVLFCVCVRVCVGMSHTLWGYI
jgi:hypothetical protein